MVASPWKMLNIYIYIFFNLIKIFTFLGALISCAFLVRADIMKNYELHHVSSGKYSDLPRAALEVLLLVHRSTREACEKWPLEPTYLPTYITQIMTKLKKLIMTTKKLKLLDNSKDLNFTTQKLKLWPNQNCDKTQKIKLWQNSKL